VKKILLDTNGYIAFKRNEATVLRCLRQSEFIGVNATVLGELLAGFKAGTKEEANKKELNLFLESPRVHVLALDDETAEYYAKVFGDLKRKGKPTPTNDMWVAASAMQHGLWLATGDEHFRDVEGLLLFPLGG
jgi:predicted nucleic acid-binding protein